MATISVNEGNNAPKNPNTEQQTPAPTASAPQASPQNTVSVNQEPKKTESFTNGITVKEQLNYLHVKERNGILTPDERKKKEKLEEQLNNDGKEGNITTEDGKKVDEEEKEPKDIFEEKDVIEYMYKDWLLGGANWLYKKLYKGVDKFIAAANARAKQRQEDNKSAKNSSYTATTHNQIGNKANKEYEKSSEAIKKGALMRQQILRGIATGEINESNADPFAKKLLSKIPPQHRKAFSADAITKIETMSKNLQTIQFMASELTQAQMAQQLIQNQDAYKNANLDAVIKAMNKRNAILFARLLSDEQNNSLKTAKLTKNLLKKIERANTFANKQIKKGRIDELNKDPKQNKDLMELNATLGIDNVDNINIAQNTDKKSMLESLIDGSQQFEQLFAQKEENTIEAQSLAAKKEENQARRDMAKSRIREIYKNNIKSQLNPRGLLSMDVQGQKQAQTLSKMSPTTFTGFKPILAGGR